jgi:hypothetical protein
MDRSCKPSSSATLAVAATAVVAAVVAVASSGASAYRTGRARRLGVALIAAAACLCASWSGHAGRSDGPREALAILEPLVGEFARETRIHLPDGGSFVDRGGARHAFILGDRHLRMECLSDKGVLTGLLLLSHDDRHDRWLLT